MLPWPHLSGSGIFLFTVQLRPWRMQQYYLRWTYSHGCGLISFVMR